MFRGCAIAFVVLISAVPGPRLLAANQADPVVRAQQLIKSGQLKSAEDLVRSALQTNSDSSNLHALLGEVLFRQHKYEDAVQEFGLAAQAKPESLKYAIRLADALIGWQHYGVAVDYLNAVKSRFERYPELHYEIGLALYSENKLKEAKQELEQALKLNPELAQASFLYAGCLTSEGDYSAAEAIFSKLIKAHGRNPKYWTALAQVQAKEGKLPEAVKASQRALALAPRNTHVQFVTATILMEAGDIDKALPLFEKLERINSNVVEVHVALARLYARQGRRELARKEADLAAELQQKTAPKTSSNPAQIPDTARQ